MGGQPPLGYDLKDRKLHINEREAALVRRIFADSAENGCVRSLKRQLDTEGAVSKRRTSNAGIAYGGHPFTTGALYRAAGSSPRAAMAVLPTISFPVYVQNCGTWASEKEVPSSDPSTTTTSGLYLFSWARSASKPF